MNIRSKFTGGLLSACLIIFFSFYHQGGQAQQFIKKVGLDNVDEGATAIIASGDGNLIVAGYQDERAVLLKMTPSGAVLWQRDFKITASGKRDVIHDIELDGNFLMGCGYGDGVDDDAFAFRYDLSTQSMVWSKVDNSTLLTRWFALTPYGGDWVFSGVQRPNVGGTESYIRTLTSAGAFVGGSAWSTGLPADDFQFAETDGSNIYFGGRAFVTGQTSFCKSRGMVTSINPFAGANWANRYFLTDVANLRMYGSDLDIDGNNLVFAGIGGTTNACNTSLYNTYVAITDLSGNVLQDNVMFINGRTRTLAREIKPNAGGYLVLGEVDNSASRDLFLMQLDANLQVTWAKTYAGTNDDGFLANSNNQLHVDSDAIYFVAQSRSYSASGDLDMMIVRTDLLGNIAEDCSFDAPATSDALSKVSTAFSWTNPSLSIATNDVTAAEDTPVIPCEIVCGCINEISAVPGERIFPEEKGIEDDMDDLGQATTSISEYNQQAEAGLSVYPNPATDAVIIESFHSESEGSRISVSNAAGTVLKQDQLTSQRIELDVSDLGSGVYLISIEHKDGSSEQTQFVKQ